MQKIFNNFLGNFCEKNQIFKIRNYQESCLILEIRFCDLEFSWKNLNKILDFLRSCLDLIKINFMGNLSSIRADYNVFILDHLLFLGL